MAKSFKEVFDNLEGASEKDLLNKKMECIRAELIYLEGMMQNLAAKDIVTKHNKAQEAAKPKKKDEDDKSAV